MSINTFNLSQSKPILSLQKLRFRAPAHTPKELSPPILQTLGLYWHFVRRYRFRVVLALVAMPAVVLTQNGLLPLIYSKIIDNLDRTHGHIPHLGRWVFLFLSLHAVVFIGQRLVSFVSTSIQHTTIRDVEQHIFHSLLKQSNHFHSSQYGGSLVAQAKRFTGAFSSLLSAIYTNIYALLIRIAVAFGFMLFIAPTLAIILLVWTIIYSASIIWLTRLKMHASQAAAAADSTMTAHLSDALGNASIIKIFGSEATENYAYRDLSHTKYAKRRRDWQLSEYVFACQSLLMIVLEITILLVSLTLVERGAFTIGKLALIQFFLAPIMASLWQIANIFRQVESGLSDASEMTRTLALDCDVKDSESTTEARIVTGRIDFRNVTFSYPGTTKKRPLLEHFDLHISAGEKIGLVGPSGSGKSSLTKLLLRLMDVQCGEITIDGHNIAHIKQSDLRKQMAFVPQEPQLFHRSIRDNIRYGRPDSTNGQIIAAAKSARAHDFIMQLPEGYDTLVGERGSKLSGGERQRIAIARAMLKDAPVVVLDEATSALDSESEKLIQAAFETLIQHKTAIVIAHRLSTIKNMDRIIVLKRGQIVEEGSHQDLLEHQGLYADLWNFQAGAVASTTTGLRSKEEGFSSVTAAT